jgi:tetratricopeptide (TPR) repeat protein
MKRTSINERLRRIVLKPLFLMIVFTGTLLISGCPSKQDAAHVDRANAYAEKGQYDQAISEYTKAIELNPMYAKAYYNRGHTYDKQDQHDEAISDFTEAIELNPMYAKAYNSLGAIYAEKGQYDQAISNCTKAIELNPKAAYAYRNRGYAYSKQDQYEEAISDYSKAIELNPKYAKAHYNRGVAYAEKGLYDKALSDYIKFIELSPQDPMFAEVYYIRGNIYAKKGQYDQAIADYTKAIELNPQLADAYNNQAWLLATCPNERYRNGAKAVEMAQKAIESTEHAPPHMLGTLAAAYAEAGRFEDAVATQTKKINMIEKGKTNEVAESVQHLESYKACKPWREK